MKLIVELTDFYLDEEGDIVPALRQHIISGAVHKITKAIQDKVELTIDKAVKKAVEEEMTTAIKKAIDEVVKSGQVKSKYDSSKTMSVEDWIKEQFSSISYGNLKETVQKLAKSHADEIKKQYDLQFATHIVARMRENEMLKDDVAKMLLGTGK